MVLPRVLFELLEYVIYVGVFTYLQGFSCLGSSRNVGCWSQEFVASLSETNPEDAEDVTTCSKGS